MANLVIDIGNSFTKIAVFKGDDLQWVNRYGQIGTDELKQLLKDHSINRTIISSVKNRQDWEADLSSWIPVVYFGRDTAINIINHYKTPQTLGIDRLAGITGARAIYPDHASLVIDAGTCITYDWVDEQGNYYGGSISPGLNMRYKAMNHYTAGLPLVNAEPDFDSTFGTDTISAMQSGVQNGLKYELEGFIKSYIKNEAELNIILTGGDGIFFDTLLKNSIFAPYIKNEPYLILKGLNAAITRT